MQALMLVARGGPTMFAWIGVMRALHRNVACGNGYSGPNS